MRQRIAVAVAVWLGVVAPAYGQVDVVAHVKADLQSRGLSLAGTCGAFEITKRVAWTLRGAGWQLVAKPDGENCAGFSGDKLVSTTGRFVDLLVDQGGANMPAWQERPATPGELGLGRDPIDPGDAGPVPPPPVTAPPVPPAPALDLSGVYAKLQELEDRQDQRFQELAQRVDAPAWYTRLMKFLVTNPIAIAAETYLVTCLSTSSCHDWLTGGGSSK